MPSDAPLDLSRRERQIMEILFRMGRASAAQVQEALDDPPSYSAVRATLRLLVRRSSLNPAPSTQQCYPWTIPLLHPAHTVYAASWQRTIVPLWYFTAPF